MEICNARIQDAKLYVEHSERLFNSNGHHDVIFSPRESGTYIASDKDVEAVKIRWGKNINDLAFEKAWVIWNEYKIIGHILLRSGCLPSQKHRIELQMGIEQGFRGQGLGRKLVSTAVDWVKEYTEIEWIDLSVFAQNTPAYQMYIKLGFEEVGRVTDRFKVYNQSIDNVDMVMKVKR